MTCVQCPANPVRTPRENRLETQWDTLNARTARPVPYRPDTRSRSATNVRQAPFQTRKKRSVSVSINNTITALSVHVSLCVCVPAKAQKLQRVRLRQNGKIYRKCVRIGWRSNTIARSVILCLSLFVLYVSRIADKRVNGRIPNMTGTGKEWPSRSV